MLSARGQQLLGTDQGVRTQNTDPNTARGVKATNDGAKRKRFIRPLHAFRGFAILNIVAVHAWSGQLSCIRDAEPSIGVSLLDAVNETLFHDSTLYFALISGLLFSLVLQPRGWTAFFKSKLHHVIAPYIVMTMAFTWYGVNADYELAGFFQGDMTHYLTKVAAEPPFGRRDVSALVHSGPGVAVSVNSIARVGDGGSWYELAHLADHFRAAGRISHRA